MISIVKPILFISSLYLFFNFLVFADGHGHRHREFFFPGDTDQYDDLRQFKQQKKKFEKERRRRKIQKNLGRLKEDIRQALNIPGAHISRKILTMPLSIQGSANLVTVFNMSLPQNRYFTKILKLAEAKLPQARQQNFLNWYFSTISFDLNSLIADNLKESLTDPSPLIRYDKRGERPLEQIISAREFLELIPLQNLNIEVLNETQRRIISKDFIKSSSETILLKDGMKKSNSENAPDDEFGHIRAEHVSYYDNWKITYKYRLISNGKLINREGEIKNYIQLSTRNKFISYQVTNKQVSYLNPSFFFNLEHCRQNVIEPDICHEVQKILKREKNLYPDIHSNHSKVLQKLVTQHMEKIISDLKLQLSKARLVKDVISAAGTFYHKMISIHPYKNGNGRLSKLVLDRILGEYGIPAPLYQPWGIDVTLLEEDLITMLEDAVIISNCFHRDLRLFLENGIDYSLVSCQYLGPGHLKEISGGLGITPKSFMKWVKEDKSPLAKKSPYYGIKNAIREYLEMPPH
jgi:hypothetical protein